MSYLVLARKWRPQTFDQVIGQEHVTRTLQNAIQSGRIAHAFLFTGPRGVGKTTIARLLAKALNCEDGPTPQPCNSCSNCTEISAGSSIDVLEIDGASHTGVDHVRDITEGVQYRPAKSRFRVVIIDEVHMLSNQAFNALLKTLEEPPDHVKFIFATTEVQKILATIVSRCQRYDFKRISLRDLLGQLSALAEHEGFACDEVGLSLIAREADGSLRDAESLLEQVVTWGDGQVNAQTVRQALGVADRQVLFQIVEAVLANDPAAVLRIAGDLYEYGYDPRRLCRDLLEHFHHLVIIKVCADPAVLSDLPDHEVTAVQDQAATRSLEDIQRLFSLLLRAEEEINQTAYPQLAVEMSLVKLASQPPVMPIDEALAQLRALREQLTTSSPNPVRAQEPAPADPQESAPTPTPASAPHPPAPPPPASPAPSPRPDPPPPAETPHSTKTPHLQPVPDPPPSPDNGDPWERLLAAVQKDKLSLFFALKSGQLHDLDQTVLTIGVRKEPYFKELSRQENRTILEEAAGRVFGRPLRIEVTKGEPPQAATQAEPNGTAAPASPNGSPPVAASPADGPAETRPNSPATTDEDPLVRTVLDVLGGEVQKTRIRGGSGRQSGQ